MTPGAPASKPFAGEPPVGSRRDFIVARLTPGALSGTAPPEIVTVTAELLATSAPAYFYVDASAGAGAGTVQAAAARFESDVWPAVTGVFGEPASPGVDGDPRIIVLQADLGGVGGYYSSDDAYLRAMKPQSNEAEMVYQDVTLGLGFAFDVVLAHELQHLIQDRNDRGEEAWVNEGLSENASGLAGGAVSSISAFARQPSVQLNRWEQKDFSAHYGAGAAFLRYLAARFGGDTVLGEIARASGDGPAGIDEFLAPRGEGLTFRAVFTDWIAANILDRAAGPYANPEPVGAAVEETLSPGAEEHREANQFGTTYWELSLPGGGAFEVDFAGEAEVPVLPTAPPPGEALLWSNAEDDVDTTLTRGVDLRDAVDPVLTFRTWYDIERWYDWGYVAVSTDGGSTWRALAGDHTTTDDPVAQAYGPGYSGVSGGGSTPEWVEEHVSLAAYAGQQLLLRFEYITDGATHGEGWAIDDIAVEGAGFRDDDLHDPGWQRDGWVRLDRLLPQTYIVRLIAEREGGEPVVLDLPLDARQRGTLRFDAGGLIAPVIAVAGSTEGTNQPAPYTLSLRRVEAP
ncbi:MAG: hypothetical protein WEC75_04220 [Dehalococcoidia bacterium]